MLEAQLGLWFKLNPYPKGLYSFLIMNQVESPCGCLQVCIRKGREASFPRNKIAWRSWKICIQYVTLRIHSKFAFFCYLHIASLRNLSRNGNATPHVHSCSERGRVQRLACLGSLLWKALVSFEFNPQEFLILGL